MTRPTPPQTEDVTKMPANLLATKLFARFFVGLGYDPHDPDAYCQGLLGPITELVKRQPESYSLARGLVAIESIRFAFTKTTRTLEEREKSLNAALAHAEQINAHDEDLKEAHWFILMDREDHAAIENTVHKDLTENPNSKIGLYYSAFLLWKKNDHLQSMILLEKANTLYPEDGRIKDTLNKAQIAKSDENPFQYKINFDLF